MKFISILKVPDLIFKVRFLETQSGMTYLTSLRKQPTFRATSKLLSARNDVWGTRAEIQSGDVILPRPWWCFWLVYANLLRCTTNQKHYPDFCIDTSSVWNICALSSEVISPGNQKWRREKSSVFLATIWLVRHVLSKSAAILFVKVRILRANWWLLETFYLFQAL